MIPVPVLEYESNATAADLRRRASIVGIGIFVTTFAQTQVIGKLPIQFLLKDRLGVGAEAMAGFFALAGFAWNIKPLAGLLSDSFPFLGYRRKSYLLLSAIGCTAFWLLMGLFHRSYGSLLAMAILMELSLVIGSTVSGGLLVEAGQRYAATGRLSFVRNLVMYVAQLISGPIAGFLAARAFGFSAVTGAAFGLLLGAGTLLWLREPRTSRRQEGAWAAFWAQLKTALRSKGLWIAGGMFFLVFVAPGFNGQPILLYQADTLHLNSQFIGYLQLFNAAGGIAASLVYLWLCPWVRLRGLLIFGIAIYAAAAICYLGYRSKPSAVAIEIIGGFTLSFAQLALFDLCARATPRGSEAMGYSVMMAMSNIGLSVSDLSGSYLYQHYQMTFMNLVWLNALTTAVTLVAVPLIPAALLARREGE